MSPRFAREKFDELGRFHPITALFHPSSTTWAAALYNTDVLESYQPFMLSTKIEYSLYILLWCQQFDGRQWMWYPRRNWWHELWSCVLIRYLFPMKLVFSIAIVPHDCTIRYKYHIVGAICPSRLPQSQLYTSLCMMASSSTSNGYISYVPNHIMSSAWIWHFATQGLMYL